MAEDLYINAGSKTEKYRALLPQLKNLLAGEDDLIANLANVSAALKETFHFFWVGFYLVKGEELVLGPFQGPILVRASGKAVVFAARHGIEPRRWLCPMWMHFPDI